MKYKLALLLSAALLCVSPVLADTQEDDSIQVVIDTPTLTYGMSGEEVTHLQEKLQQLSYYCHFLKRRELLDVLIFLQNLK